jgi:membrane protein
VVNRFQKIVGFDRAVALASSALTAIIPLAIITSSLGDEPRREGHRRPHHRPLRADGRRCGGGEGHLLAVQHEHEPRPGRVVFFLVALLSFTRAVQRLFEQTWELKPLSVRNSLNGLLWIGGLTLYMGFAGLLHGWLGRGELDVAPTLIVAPLSFVFLIWSGRVLSAKRLERRRLVPFGVVGAALLAVYSLGAAVYVPHLFDTYATRYGVIGAVFAMISALFCMMVVVVGSAALGREVDDELVRIRRGERPADNEVRRQWDEITSQARTRWEAVRTRRT